MEVISTLRKMLEDQRIHDIGKVTRNGFSACARRFVAFHMQIYVYAKMTQMTYANLTKNTSYRENAVFAAVERLFADNH